MSWGETIFLKRVIDGKKSFRASENPLVVFNSLTTVFPQETLIGEFKPKTKGQVNLVVVVPEYAGYDGIIEIKKNNVVMNLFYILSSTEKNVLKFALDAKKGDTYQFKVIEPIKADMIYIGADIVDGSLFDYTIGG